LISNYHVVKDATKVRLLTGAGLIDAKVVQVDAANDLALLKADGKFSSLPISSSRSAQLGGTVATVGFPDIGLQGFASWKVISDVWRVTRFLVTCHSSHLRRWRWHERGVAGECQLRG
jgi:S1-C subfamily serine protease